MPSQLFNLKRYFGDQSDQNNDTLIGTNDNLTLSQSPSAPAEDISPVQMPTLATPMEPTKREDISLLTHFSQRLNSAITLAAQEASRTKQEYIEPEHILYGLLFDASVFRIVAGIADAVTPTTIQEQIKTHETIGTFTNTPLFSQKSRDIFETAQSLAKTQGSDFMNPEHVLLAIVSLGNSQAASILAQNSITQNALEKQLPAKEASGKPVSSALEIYGTDLTKKARDNLLDPVVARDNEIERVVQILSRRTKNNPVLVGEAGVGKTAIVEGFAQKIVGGTVPLDLRNKRIINLDLTSLVAGASHRGEFEDRLKKLIKELKIAAGEVILFIDEMHTLVGAGGGEGTLDASNILKPFLSRGEIQLIGTSTIDEYRRYIEKDPALERRFQQVLVEEPTVEQAIAMLTGIKPRYESFHGVSIPNETIEAAVKLAKQYISDRFLPDKAVDLIDEAASKIRIANTTTNPKVLTQGDIETIVSSWTGIPVTKLSETESQRLLNLEKLIHDRLIDQEGAVTAVAEAVRRGRAGLKDINRPIGSFLFMGPTGVGKTELAKSLAAVLFGSETLMIRLDMSEYMEKHEVAKLIGAPPGYVGYEEGGQLTEAVRTKPYCVILLDEIEKAHPDVFNMLIQVLEDGRLTDNKGRTVSFKNTIIIATSNIGTALIQKQDMATITKQSLSHTSSNLQSSNIGVGGPQEAFAKLTQTLMSELQKFFKPELLNRFDEIIVFKPLLREHMQHIAVLNIARTKKRLAEQKIGLEITSDALNKLSELGFDPLFGARPLRRIIQTHIENPISTLLIKKAFQEADTILISLGNAGSEFTFEKKPTQAPQPPTYQNTNTPSVELETHV